MNSAIAHTEEEKATEHTKDDIVTESPVSTAGHTEDDRMTKSPASKRGYWGTKTRSGQSRGEASSDWRVRSEKPSSIHTPESSQSGKTTQSVHQPRNYASKSQNYSSKSKRYFSTRKDETSSMSGAEHSSSGPTEKSEDHVWRHRLIGRAQSYMADRVRDHKPSHAFCEKNFPWLPDWKALKPVISSAIESCHDDTKQRLNNAYPETSELESFMKKKRPWWTSRIQIDKENRGIYVSWQAVDKATHEVFLSGRGKTIKVDSFNPSADSSTVEPDASGLEAITSVLKNVTLIEHAQSKHE